MAVSAADKKFVSFADNEDITALLKDTSPYVF